MTNIQKIQTNEKETEKEIEKQKEETNENGKGKEKREHVHGVSLECSWIALGWSLIVPSLFLDGSSIFLACSWIVPGSFLDCSWIVPGIDPALFLDGSGIVP